MIIEPNPTYGPRSGHLRSSNLDLSGKYKILISDKLYFSDYSGRKIPIDLSKSIIPQLCEFLRTPSAVSMPHTYSASNMKYHLPLYIDKYTDPKSLLVFAVKNKPYPKEDLSSLLKESKTLRIIDFEKTNLTKVLKEILQESPTSPISIDSKTFSSIGSPVITLHGLNYDTNTWCNVPVNFSDDITTTGIEYWQYNIPSEFRKHNLIYPHFINVEVDFEFIKEQYGKDFQNFYACVTTKERCEPPNIVDGLPDDSKIVKWYDYVGTFVDVDFSQEDTLTPQRHLEKDATVLVKDINNQEHLYKVKVTALSDEESIVVKNSSKTVVNYKLGADDIKNTLYETVSSLCTKLKRKTNYALNPVPEINSQGIFIYFKSPVQYEYHFYTGDKESKNILPSDRHVGEDIYYLSMNITSNDVSTDRDIDAIKLKINDFTYKVVKEFTYDSRHIVRLDSQINISYNTPADIYNYYSEEFITFKPLPLLGLPEIENVPLYDFDAFKQELGLDYYTLRYPSPLLGDGLNKKYDIMPHQDFNFIFINSITSFSTLHTLNLNSTYGKTNGSQEKWGYFLLQCEPPDYVLSNIRYSLYFDDKPKVYSTFERYTASSVECVFMGVKYSADIKYEGYKFAVALRSERDTSLQYLYCEVDDINKTVILWINRNFSFWGVDKIDISLFYNINSSFRLSQQHREDYNKLGLHFAHMISPQELSQEGYEDYIYREKFVVVRDSSSIDNLNDIITYGETFVLYDFAEEYVEERDENVEFCVYKVEFVNCQDIRPNSMLCDDIVVTMMMGECDDKTSVVSSIFINHGLDSTLHDDTDTNFIFDENVAKHFQERYVHQVKNWENVYINRFFSELKNNSGTSTQIKCKDMLEPVSLKKEWFRLTYKRGSATRIESFDNRDVQSMTLHQVQALVDNKYLTSERTERTTKNNELFTVDIFDSNKFWDIIQHYVTNLYTDRFSETSLQRYVENFSLNTTVTYLKNNLIQIKDSDKMFKLELISPAKMSTPSFEGYRFTCGYRPFFGIFDDIVECTNQVSESPTDELPTLYMKDFSGPSQSATGDWQEIQDIVSTLFVGTDYDFEFTPQSENVDLRELISKQIVKDQYIINDENKKYLSSITGDVDSYLLTKYSEYILTKFYQVKELRLDGKRISYRTKDFILEIPQDYLNQKLNILIVRKK